MNLKEYMVSNDSNLFWRLDGGEQLNLLDEAIEKIEQLEGALNALLDGLDANSDERCGLTQEQWDARVKAARAAQGEERAK